ncbi:mRNA capping enzyme, catalytic domain-containing protein [Zychaea mexicana]|uniref:mRNA capping enzyme, catalytic domain-containing protein n=1 Tax=Zychaea mexicana TaxID=64656 RepID=UPI0022FE0FEA|nr:mRNA capping enzyme, catalytic domain-containing protein [Zychaea mexicana]KAI9496632.1 mRNA capping enzyme, catalytic domain-containing protein [Zychaea mexicana]
MNHSAVPNIPGIPVRDDRFLKEKIAKLLNMRSYRFPGAQPVSFGSAQLEELEKEDYFVAEKSDGVRCLALLTVNERNEQKVYLFDRKSNFHVVDNIRFPIPQDPSFRKCLSDTIIDGEFVLDTEPDGSTTLRFLLFDCLVIAKILLTSRDLMKRLGYLRNEIIRPHHVMLKRNPHMVKHQPFSVEFKEQQFTYHLDTVFKQIIPALRHGNDGLIFTSVVAPYVLGTSEKMIKWKPANENSIDFKVHVTFPGSTLPDVPDLTARPRIDLLVWKGGDRYEYFNELGITDMEWKQTFGNTPQKLQGRIIECNYDPEAQEKYNLQSPWRFMRYRDDKPDGNHKSTVDKVLNSIKDAVTQEELIARIPSIRDAWSERKKKASEKKAEEAEDNL